MGRFGRCYQGKSGAGMIKGDKAIIESGLLKKADIESLELLAKELDDNFAKSQVFRTRTEMEISVLDNVRHPTPESKYWQAVREQSVMFTELTMLSYEYRKNDIKIKMLARDIEVETDPLKKELLQVEIDEKIFFKKNQRKTANARMQEILNWSEIKDREAKKINPTNLENPNNHQLISYTKRWINQSISMGANGSPAERQNLLGQLRSGLEACIENGIIDDVLADFPVEIINKIKKEYPAIEKQKKQ